MVPLIEADATQVELIVAACEANETMLSRNHDKRTERLLLSWEVPMKHLESALLSHIKNGNRIFKKVAEGHLLSDICHANVELFEGHDVYVQIWLRGDRVILSAHGHYTENLLPK